MPCSSSHLLVEEGALLDDKALQGELAAGALEQAPLHAVRCRQAQHQHRLLLPDAVAPVHCLQGKNTTSVSLFVYMSSHAYFTN